MRKQKYAHLDWFKDYQKQFSVRNFLFKNIFGIEKANRLLTKNISQNEITQC